MNHHKQNIINWLGEVFIFPRLDDIVLQSSNNVYSTYLVKTKTNYMIIKILNLDGKIISSEKIRQVRSLSW